jgi:hypothetical protein
VKRPQRWQVAPIVVLVVGVLLTIWLIWFIVRLSSVAVPPY